MKAPHSRLLNRIVRIVCYVVLGVAGVYLLAGNLVLRAGILKKITNEHPESFRLDYQSGWTFIPGVAHVKGLQIAWQSGHIAFDLRIDQVTTRIALLELMQRRFHATRVRAKGVSWRMVYKVESLEAAKGRVAAFPQMPFGDPPLAQPSPPEEPDHRPWVVHIEDVDVAVKEIWEMEWHYQGSGRATGSFQVDPANQVWVGPARLDLEPGTLMFGETPMAKDFVVHGTLRIDPFTLKETHGLDVFRVMRGTARVTATLDDVTPVQAYTPKVQVSGTGTLDADVVMDQGRLTRDTRLALKLATLKLTPNPEAWKPTPAFSFAGTINNVLTVDQKPLLHSAAEGSLRFPLAEGKAATAVVADLVSDLALTTDDMSKGPVLAWLHARLGEGTVSDVSSILAIVSKRIPVVAPIVLGDGPLTVSGTLDVTPDKMLVQLQRAKLGDSEFSGAVQKDDGPWAGACAGRASVVQLGVNIEGAHVSVVPFIHKGWLAERLSHHGIKL